MQRPFGSSSFFCVAQQADMRQPPAPTPLEPIQTAVEAPGVPQERKRRRTDDTQNPGGAAKLQRTATLATAAAAAPDINSSTVLPLDMPEQQPYCICQQPYTAESAMVSCDACNEWFHTKCVGLSRLQARSAKTYKCPLCKSLRVRFPTFRPTPHLQACKNNSACDHAQEAPLSA